MLEKLERERRAAKVRIAGEERWIAAEDAGPLPRRARRPAARRAAGRLPRGPPTTRWLALARRYARTHGPFPTGAARRPLRRRPAARAARARARAANWSAASCCPAGPSASGATPRCCAACAAPASPTCAREVEAADRRELARFLPSWQNVDAHRPAGAGPDRLREALVPLQGVALTPEVWERDVLPRRLGAYSPAWLDQLCTGGELVWIGAGALGRSDGSVALYFREDVRLAGPPPANAKLEPPAGRAPRRDPRAARRRGPGFWVDLVAELEFSPEELHEALWDLAWAGEATNDAFAPLRAPRLSRACSDERALAAAASPRRRAAAGQAVQGRWSLTAPLFEDAPADRPAAARAGRADARALRDRHPRDGARRGRPGRLRQRSTASCRTSRCSARRAAATSSRGSAGAQFALPGAVERLRSLPRERGALPVLAATDPANPYGAALPWPKREQLGGRRPSRTPGAYVLLRDGEPMLFVERGGRGVLRLADLEGEELGGGASRRSPRPPPTG